MRAEIKLCLDDGTILNETVMLKVECGVERRVDFASPFAANDVLLVGYKFTPQLEAPEEQ